MTMRMVGTSLAALVGMACLGSTAHAQVVQRFDPIYDHQSGGQHHMRGDAIWVVFARCAALYRNVDAVIESAEDERLEKRAKALPEHLSHHDHDPQTETRLRERMASQETRFTEKGLEVMAQERPGQMVEAEFRAQIDREYAELRSQPYMTVGDIEGLQNDCRVFSFAIGQNALIDGRRRARGPGIPVSIPLSADLIARIRARDGH